MEAWCRTRWRQNGHSLLQTSFLTVLIILLILWRTSPDPVHVFRVRLLVTALFLLTKYRQRVPLANQKRAYLLKCHDWCKMARWSTQDHWVFSDPWQTESGGVKTHLSFEDTGIWLGAMLLPRMKTYRRKNKGDGGEEQKPPFVPLDPSMLQILTLDSTAVWISVHFFLSS